jgi:hypothetical protein
MFPEFTTSPHKGASGNTGFAAEAEVWTYDVEAIDLR